MNGCRKHHRATEITQRSRLVENSLLRVGGGASRADSVVSCEVSLTAQEKKTLLSRFLPRRKPDRCTAFGKLNENGTQFETVWVREQCSNGKVKSTMMVRNLGPLGRIYEVTRYDGNGTFETVTERDGILIYQCEELEDSAEA